MILPPSSYPLIGAGFFMSHPSLWIRFLCPFVLTLVGGLVALVFSFAFLLPLQAHALINVHCPAAIAWIVCVIFVILEASVLTLILFALLLPIFMDALFDATLRARGLGRILDAEETSCWVGCYRGMWAGVLIIFFQVVLLIITLPIHAVPVAGTIVYCILNGWVLTWSHHIHYDIEIRHFTVAQSRSHGWKRREDYISYGAIAVALELIPFANILFMWTNVCGVALWVADEIEEQERRSAVPSSAIPNSFDPEQPLIVSGHSMDYGSPAPPRYTPRAKEGWKAVKSVWSGN